MDYLCSSKIIQIFFFFALLIKDNIGPAEMHQQAKDNCGNWLTFSTLNCPCIREKGMRDIMKKKIFKANSLRERVQEHCTIQLVFCKSIKGTRKEKHNSTW